MLRCFLALALVSFAFAQQESQQQKPAQKKLETKRPKPAAGPQEEVPPEEDKDLTTTEYSFNPLQSQKDIGVGNQYFKNHKYRAAELRYTSATKWNDGNPEAWLKLGEVEERLKDTAKAKAAYRKYIELASDDSKAARKVEEIRKKVEKMK